MTVEQAVFDQSAMAWMDQSSGYAPVLKTENRYIGGVQTNCQVLTCYMHLLPSSGNTAVVPGDFGTNLTVNVKSMKNGDKFAPILSAAMEYGTWDGNCETHNKAEKQTVTAQEVTVSAAPKYNIKIDGTYSDKDTFNFSTGNSTAQAYGEGYINSGNNSAVGRLIRMGIVIQLYNDYPSKGFRGIELPNGEPITFDVALDTKYRPDTNTETTQDIDVNGNFMPRLWSCDGIAWAVIGTPASAKSINVNMQIKLNPGKSTDVNGFDYNCYVNTLSSGDNIITTNNSAVNRSLEGLAWIDVNADGLQNETADKVISGVKVTLMKLKVGGDPTKATDYEEYHYHGDSSKEIVAIETDKSVSVWASNSSEAVDY